MDFIQNILLSCSVILPAIIAYILGDRLKPYFGLLLTFSGAFLMGISFIHLIPEAFGRSKYDNLGVFILIGFLIQLCLDFMSKGVEHGHVHKQDSQRSIFFVCAGLFIHAFLEGMPLLDSHQVHIHGEGMHIDHSQEHMFFAIILHKIPAALALTLLLLVSKVKRIAIIGIIVLFSMMTPLGGAIGSHLSFIKENEPIITAIVIGSLLHISTTILFEMDKKGNHDISITKVLVILFGFGLAMLTIH